MEFNSFQSSARRICILFRKEIEYKIIKSKADQNGNLLALDLELEGKQLTLINIYGPNEDSPDFYTYVSTVIEEFNNEEVIIFRDFNLVQNQEADTYNYRNINNPRAKETVLNLKEELNLIDPFREIYSDIKNILGEKITQLNRQDSIFFF